MTRDLALSFAISFLTVQFLGPILYAWMARGRTPSGRELDGYPVMRFPGRFKVVAFLFLGFVLLVVGWVLAARPWQLDGAIALLSISTLLTATVLTAVWYFDGLAHEIRPDGLLYTARWSRPRLFRWAELGTVEFNPLANAWRLRTATEAAWIGQGLSGQHFFAAAVLQYVPSATIDRGAGTRKLLEDVAALRGGATFGQ